MQYLALVSFSGVISMHKGEVRELSDTSLVEDLLKAGYIIPFEATNKKKEPKKEDVTKTTKRKGKTNE